MYRIFIQHIFFVTICLSFNITFNGQTGSKDIPYVINIKENIKNIKVINLSTLGTEISYIPLQTTSDCLIQEIRKVEISNSYIFISEYYRLLQFERNGKFLRQIGSAGRGPGEYTAVYDFCIDEQKEEIYIISHSPYKLLKFDFDGRFKKSANISFRPAMIILKDQNSLMYHNVNSPGKEEPSWVITNREGIIISTIKNNLKRITQPGYIVNTSPLYKFNNKIHFMEFGIDTLYYFNNSQKKTYATFLLGDLKMNPDPNINSQSLRKNLRENLNGKLRISSILESNEFLFIRIYLGITDAKMFAIYNKKTNVVTFLKDNLFVNDLGGGIGFWPKQVVNDNIFVDYMDAFDLMKHTIPSELRSRISETSNPVMVLLK